MLLEVCANSYQSALHAQIAGAKRIELCQRLEVGGLTPNEELLKKVLQDISIPVFVLVRPREGDFVYTDAEFQQMKQHTLLFKDLGCHGIVSGILNDNRTIDLERTKELVELSKPLPFTFHRAFDTIQDPMKGLHQLINLGVKRILTSGQEPTAFKGLNLLKSLKDKAKDAIVILPGGGIHPQNAKSFKENKFVELHSSARSKSGELVNDSEHSNQEIIKELIRIIS